MGSNAEAVVTAPVGDQALLAEALSVSGGKGKALFGLNCIAIASHILTPPFVIFLQTKACFPHAAEEREPDEHPPHFLESAGNED